MADDDRMDQQPQFVKDARFEQRAHERGAARDRDVLAVLGLPAPKILRDVALDQLRVLPGGVLQRR